MKKHTIAEIHFDDGTGVRLLMSTTAVIVVVGVFVVLLGCVVVGVLA